MTDGIAGHENQSQGLIDALARLQPVEQHDIAADSGASTWLAALSSVWKPAGELPKPDLILGAGHSTHATLIAAKRSQGAKAVVLMSPSLPAGLFDLCIIPEHDKPPQATNILATQGVLNRMTAVGSHLPGQGLILVGGPSSHHEFAGDALLAQIRALIDASPDMQFTLGTSRRTPATWVSELAQLALPHLSVVAVEQTDSGWVAGQLGQAACAWVTEDSVSMLYEALSAGVQVGVLHMPRKGSGGRVAKGLDDLARRGLVTWFRDWLAGNDLSGPFDFNEADRCANWILEEWLAS